jgi:hypothetical protein
MIEAIPPTIGLIWLLGRGRGAVNKTSPLCFPWVMNHTNRGGCCLENLELIVAVSDHSNSGSVRPHFTAAALHGTTHFNPSLSPQDCSIG